ncbi:unnamed protein product [Brassicogethes aeneus]|uniref:Uncharacterized protein n=1 Tax=Brassicogethes aeneus TaxID=1431903 RepID=A0A9P0BHZ4_BRAAE|nr:unnamed protein product [Brassicogethes aeneus]
MNEFLTPFVSELAEILENKLTINNREYTVIINAFICDAPARAAITSVQTHSSYQEALEKCNHLLDQTDSSDSNDQNLYQSKRRTKSVSQNPDFKYYLEGYINSMPDSPKSPEDDKDKTITPLEENSVPEVTVMPKVLCSRDGAINVENLVIKQLHCKCDGKNQ